MINILTDGKSNTKTAKNSLRTYYLSLQPTNLNSKGENLCKFSTKECSAQCLQYAGRQGFSNVVKSRERKTELFVNDKSKFLIDLFDELVKLNKKGRHAVRLNLLSDVNWENEFKKIGHSISELNNTVLYDYTKDPFKIELNNLPNYNLTFSFSGGNWKWCEKFLNEKKANVAVVFENHIPETYLGFDVIDGTINDERFLDKKGVIVGLKYKKPKGKKIDMTDSKFVVRN